MSTDNATYVAAFASVDDKSIYFIASGGASYADELFGFFNGNNDHYEENDAKMRARHFFSRAERIVGTKDEVFHYAYDIDCSIGTEYGVIEVTFNFPYDEDDEETLKILNDSAAVAAICEGMDDISAGRMFELDGTPVSSAEAKRLAALVEKQRDSRMGDHAD